MGIRQFVGKMQVNRNVKLMEPAEVLFPKALLSPKHVLVCLPLGLRELTTIKQFLPVISQLFKPADITLLAHPGVKLHDIYPRKGFQIISPALEQVGWSGVPKRSFLENLRSMNFDAVLDLNLESSLFMASVLINFPRAIRIGRGNLLGEPYYNLEIKTRFLRDEKNIYRSLLEMLGIMMNRPVDGLPIHTSR